jgi:hypothetical protein
VHQPALPSLPRHGDVALHLVHPSVSPGSRRTSPRTSPSASPELFGRPSLLARAPVGHTSTIFGIAAATSSSASLPLRPNTAGVRRRLHRSSSPARRLAAPPPSSASQRRVPRHPRLRAAAAGCPRRLLAGPGRRRRRPLVVPGRCGVRPSVKPFSSAARVSSSVQQPRRRLRPRLRVVKPRAGRVSPSSQDRCRSRSLAVRRARSSLSFPRLVAWW